MVQFQNILALDTALGGCSAAAVAGENAAVRSLAMARGQAEHLVPYANEVMGECGVEYEALDTVLCTIGPGAFTGLRIGMSAARAYGLSLGIPVYGITTFDALAIDYAAQYKGAFNVAIETKRADFYVQAFDGNGAAAGVPLALMGEDAADVLDKGAALIGDGAQRFANEMGGDWRVIEGFDLPDMVKVAKILQANADDTRFVLDAQPLYLRGADVSMPKTPLRKVQEKA